MKRLLLFSVLGLAVAIALWYWFRPEKLFVNKRVDEAAPSDIAVQSAQPIFTGRFRGELHHTMGRASVFAGAGGSTSLRLTDFKTSNGPALHILLVSSANVSTDSDFALDPQTSIDLGDLKGNEGDQNYSVPAGIDFIHFDTVSIYCERFHANFGIAKLEAF
jgi:hypothetical protein